MFADFEYYAPTKIFFGRQKENNVGKIIKSYGFKKILIHYGMGSIKNNGIYDRIINSIKNEGIEYIELGGVSPNPKLYLVKEGIELCKSNDVDMILAIGGGSVIDSAKGIAVGSKVDFDPWLFSTHAEKPNAAIPVGVILTIAAAGSEMSSSCVITNEITKEKRGFNSEKNRPLFAIMNPELTYSVNKFQTGCGIVDILMHTLERYFSKTEGTEITDKIAEGLMKTVINQGIIAINNPNDYNSRANLMWASSLSHNNLTGCGKDYIMSVHQIEHEISGMFDKVAHGAGLSVIWPSWAIEAYESNIDKFSKFAYNVMDINKSINKKEAALQGIMKLKDYFSSIGMPTSLKELNIDDKSIEALAYNLTFKGKRILNDIINIDYETCLSILKRAL